MEACGCRQCLKAGPPVKIMGLELPGDATLLILCPKCGNKRCPHANDHRNPCTDSNASGQKGSAYP